ncbi:MAG: NAD-dependent protein deacylase [SAR324 cluster bacterium]|nr:NAD-dependent protein deacylase [SAR324 cluster bacterium]
MESYSEIANLLRKANNVLFITGAGVSADSGLPTYRGVGGLYEDQSTEDGIPIEEALSGRMLLSRPEISWKYIWEIGAACQKASHNRAHEVIAAIEAMKPESWVLTQNVDGFHRTAGSKNLIEIHGHIFDLFCVRCAYRVDTRTFFSASASPPDLPPKCPQCQGLIRPDVVLFEELLPEKEVQKLDQVLDSEIDMIFSIGTTAVFPYIIQPVLMARKSGKPTVEINPALTDLSNLVDYHLKTGAAEAMDRLWKMLQN